MRVRNTAVQIVILILAAASIAIVANAFASRTRRLVLPGYYPDARRVPPRVAETVPPPPVLTATTDTKNTTATTDTTNTTATTDTTTTVVTTTTTAPEIRKPAAEAAAAPQKPPTPLTPH